MRTIMRTTALAAVLVVGVGALGACSSDDGEEAAPPTTEASAPPTTEASAPRTTEASAPTTIEATGTLLGGVPSSASRQPDGSEIVVSQEEMQGDLAGTVDLEEHLLVTGNPLTFTVFESTGTFTGTVEGVGSGTLTFTTSAPENVYDQNTATVQSGTVGDGTGDLAGYEGTIEMVYTLLFGGAIEDGTYTVDLEYVG